MFNRFTVFQFGNVKNSIGKHTGLIYADALIICNYSAP